MALPLGDVAPQSKPPKDRTPYGSGSGTPSSGTSTSTGSGDVTTYGPPLPVSTTSTTAAEPSPSADEIARLLGFTTPDSPDITDVGLVDLGAMKALAQQREREAQRQARREERRERRERNEALLDIQNGPDILSPPTLPDDLNNLTPADRDRLRDQILGFANEGLTPEQVDARSRNTRERVLGLDQERKERRQGQKPEKPTIDPMTWDEYNALDDRERAAVDFNTALVSAVRRDKKQNRLGAYDDLTEDERRIYDQAVLDMFGEDGGSRRYAPDTMALLNQLELEDQEGDLDDFLRLREAITEDDLKNLGDPMQGPVAEGEPGQVGVREGEFTPDETAMLDYQLELTTATQQLQAELAQGNLMLQDWRTTALAARGQVPGLTPPAGYATTAMFGGTQRVKGALPLGFGMGAGTDANGQALDANTYFQMNFDTLAQLKDETQVAEFLGQVQATIEPGDYPKFLDYVDMRSAMAKRYHADLGAADGVEYRTPEEFRKLLGLDK